MERYSHYNDIKSFISSAKQGEAIPLGQMARGLRITFGKTLEICTQLVKEGKVIRIGNGLASSYMPASKD